VVEIADSTGTSEKRKHFLLLTSTVQVTKSQEAIAQILDVCSKLLTNSI